MTNHVRIFDTTLRDGEQSPGCSMTRAQKLSLARALVELGVDTLEAGFAAASPDDYAAVQEIARTVRGSGVAARSASAPTWFRRSSSPAPERTRWRCWRPRRPGRSIALERDLAS